MIKRFGVLTLAVTAFVAFAASLAQGEQGKQWKHHTSNLTAHAQVHLAGKAKFSNIIIGGIQCPITMQAQLTKGTSHAHIDQFIVTNYNECQMNGFLLTECEKFTLAEPTDLPWTGTGTTPAGGPASVDITKVVLHGYFQGKMSTVNCPPKVTLESTATAFPTLTLNAHHTASSGTLGGTLTGTRQEIKGGKEEQVHVGPMGASGTLTLTPAETYGLAT